MAEKYLLRATCGPTYDPAGHETVAVNSSKPVYIETPHCTAAVTIRVQNYRGLPRSSPSTSPYFSHPPHVHDQYSIAFTLIPHTNIPGSALVFGNDFDKPVRDRLPPGTGAAFKIVKWAIDPGLDGDLYADEPYLYGAAGSSLNILRVGGKVGEGKGLDIAEEGKEEEKGIEEGGDGDGGEWRTERGVPEGADARKRWFLTKENAEGWVWERGRVYKGDFFNPYLDFNDFSLKLPGFSLSVLGYLGGDDFLRYVLKNKDTGDVLFVVVFTLLHREDVEKEEAEAAKKEPVGEGKKDGGKEADAEEVKPTSSGTGEGRHEGEKNFEPRADDLD